MGLAGARIAIHDHVLTGLDEVQRFQFRKGDCHVLRQFCAVKIFEILHGIEVSLLYEPLYLELLPVLALLCQSFGKETVIGPFFVYCIRKEDVKAALDAAEFERPAALYD